MQESQNKYQKTPKNVFRTEQTITEKEFYLKKCPKGRVPRALVDSRHPQ